MNKAFFIGNLTRDPEMRQTNDGRDVCHFTIAVNRQGRNTTPDYVNISAWGQLGKNCSAYLQKGRKVCAVGGVHPNGYIGQDGEVVTSLNMDADSVEFLDPANK